MSKSYIKKGRIITVDAAPSEYSPKGGTGGAGGELLISEHMVTEIEAILRKGDRVEIIPVKDGIKVIHIKREEVKK